MKRKSKKKKNDAKRCKKSPSKNQKIQKPKDAKTRRCKKSETQPCPAPCGPPRAVGGCRAPRRPSGTVVADEDGVC